MGLDALRRRRHQLLHRGLRTQRPPPTPVVEADGGNIGSLARGGEAAALFKCMCECAGACGALPCSVCDGVCVPVQCVIIYRTFQLQKAPLSAVALSPVQDMVQEKID